MKQKSRIGSLSTLFLLLVIASLFCLPAQSQTEDALIKGTTTTAEQYQWKSKILTEQVKEALAQGEQNYIGPIISLMEAHQDNPNEVLLLLKPFLKDANEETQDTIIRATSFAKTKLALEILSSLLPDRSNGRSAAIAIYQNFNCEQLQDQGGSQLKNALFRAIFKRRDAVESYLLFSCFSPDEKTVDFLKKRRKSFEANGENQTQLQGEETVPLDRSQEVAALDLALVEMGDRDALTRVSQLLSVQNGKEKELQSLLRYLKFVKSKPVLRQTVELLKNQSEILKAYNPDGSIHSTVRVCDLAYFHLGERTGTLPKKYQNLDETELPHFSNEELVQAAKEFNLILEL